MLLRRFLSLALSALLLATATPAAAQAGSDEIWDYADPADSSVDAEPRQSPPNPAASREVPAVDLSAAGYVGLVTVVAGLGIGVQPLGRYGLFGFGGFMETAGGLGGAYAGGGALAGLSLRSRGRFRGDLLGALGVRGYSGWRAGWLFSDDPGARAMLPHAGVRARGVWILSPARHTHFEIGAMVFGDQDLYRRRVEYDYLETSHFSWFGDDTSEPHWVHESKEVGGANLGLVLTLGTTIDFR